MASTVSRRSFLAGTAIAAVSLGTGGRILGAGADSPQASGKSFRFVHLTDLHIQPERNATQGVIACLKAVNELQPRPDFILTGGDLVMDVFDHDSSRAKLLFDLLVKTFKDYAGIPVHHCIGNHDIFGWSNRRGVTADHPQYGKKMVCERLELPKTYYTFDHQGWRFYVLDDIQPAEGNAYQSYIDEAQLNWLKTELESKPADMPAAAVCHIPILSTTVFVDTPKGKEKGKKKDEEKDKKQEEAYMIPYSIMCRDARSLAELFAKHNVKLALSGHTHEFDIIEFRGVKFICDGAVSGAWWKGSNNSFEEGFGILDLSADGSVAHRYYDYGWKVEEQVKQ